MKAVILAAGMGTRINHNRETIPKPLYEVNNKCLIEHVIENIRKAGITEFVVVIGFMAEKIKERLGDGTKYGVKIEYTFNPEYEKPVGLSVLCSEKYINEPFILSMSDHIMEFEGLKKIIDYPLEKDSCALLVDKKIDTIFWLDDAAKVKLEENKIKGVNKKFESFDAIDCGVFKHSPIIFNEIRRMIHEPDSISAAVSNFCKQGKMFAVDIEEYKWVDIDEYEELEVAREIFKNIN
ncbi:NTP transferase domain-containing protein [Candidatus Woesearchaeota archaeon]|jgi:choline kinase|nr:NTP transferase domain-containing protein [Candidatus Woesearchaeota archaeon]